MGKKGSIELDRLREECPEFEKYIHLLIPRQQTVLKQRLKGLTLKEVGSNLPRTERAGGGTGVSPELVRQQERKAIWRLLYFHRKREEEAYETVKAALRAADRHAAEKAAQGE